MALIFHQVHLIRSELTTELQELGADGKLHTNWFWPNGSQDGFVLDNANQAIKTKITLGSGTLLDRFGNEDTAYFAPFATPYAMRSLPPSSLNDPYAVYVVKQALEVYAGPIAPGFEQSGLGTQYIVADGKLKEKDSTGKMKLFEGTWLRKLRPDEVERLYKMQLVS